MVNEHVTLECLGDKGRDKYGFERDRYKLGCYIRGELLSTKGGKISRLKKWAVGKKQGLSLNFEYHGLLYLL